MNITPYFLGSGRAAAVMEQALAIVALQEKSWRIEKVVRVARGQSFSGICAGAENPVLFVANPHALHAPAVIEAQKCGFKMVVCEKPAAVNSTQIEALRQIQIPVAVFHVYRQMWGIQKLRQMYVAGDFGKIVAIEGRYWQSSAAQKTAAGLKADAGAWKNNQELSGPHDVLLDIAVHWVDAAAFVAGATPKSIKTKQIYLNAESPHRDTHVFVDMEFKDFEARSSISKTVHGAANHFEINILGEKKSATWNFSDPDTLVVGEGAVLYKIPRGNKELYGTGHAPYHGAGWLEGYIEIIRAALNELAGKPSSYPRLPEHLNLLSLLV